MKAMLILILVLSIYTIASTAYFFISIRIYKKEVKKLKNSCKTISNDLENIALRLTSGNSSHMKGNIRQVSEYLKHLNN